MNWKKLLSDFFLYAGVIFATFMLVHWKSSPQYDSPDVIKFALGAAAIALGWVGFEELARGGHSKVRRILRYCILIWFALNLIFMGITLLTNMTLLDFAVPYFIYPFWLLFAAAFPLALYLNRNQGKSASPPTINNAS